jgi:hypothetical protein
VKRRVIGTVLLGLGIALVVLAAGLRFYVYPAATNIPYDLEPSTTIAESRTSTYLSISAAGARIETGTLRSSTYVVPQPVLTKEELTGDLADTAVIWDVYDQVTDTSSGTVVTASSSQVALDRKSGEYAAWDGAWVDSGDGEEAFTGTGLSSKLPFGAEKITYPYWEDTLGREVALDFVSVDKINDLEVYVYEYTVDAQKIAYDEDSKMALSGIFGDGDGGDVYYSVTRTVWVEPVTGQFLNVRVQNNLEFRDANGTDTVTMLKGDFQYTDEEKADTYAGVKENHDLIVLVSSTLPLAAGGAGAVLLIIGIVLLATGRRTEDDDTLHYDDFGPARHSASAGV